MEELLIKKVKERDFLFDVKSPSYKDRNVRQEAWEQIGRELNMKPEIVKEKWLKLRRCFTNALNRRRWKQNDEAAKKISSWKFGKQMSFLLPHLDTRKVPSYIEDSQQIDCKQELDLKHSDEEDQPEDIDFDNEKNDSITEDAEDSEIATQNALRKSHNILHMGNRESERRLQEKDDNPLMRILTDTSALQQFIFPEKNFKIPNLSDYADFDESDMFYLSMSKMAKRLPLVAQAKIKLLLSQAVLEAEIANASKQMENVMANLSASFMSPTDPQSSSVGNN